MPKILLTAFEPWGSHTQNSSQRLLESFVPELPADWHCEKLLLPVSWTQAPALLEARLSELPAEELELVMALGMATEANNLRMEFFAHNQVGLEQADVNGEYAQLPVVERTGPYAYCATVPTREITRAWADAEIPGRLSLDAGHYLCNTVFYHLMHRFAPFRYQPKIGFLHVPPVSKMKTETAQRALKIALEVSCPAMLENEAMVVSP